MKKLIAAVILGSLLVGCDSGSVGTAKSGSTTYTRVCVDSVEYLTNGYRMSPHYKPDGSLYTCN